MNHSTLGLPVHHQLLEFTQTHVHQVGNAIQPSHPLSSPSPPAPNPFLCVSSHYLILPRVSSLIVWGLRVSAPTLKAQGLIPGQEQRSHEWFVMALSEIKTNTQK